MTARTEQSRDASTGFTVLAAASLGLLGVGAATPLWLIAFILACRSACIGLVINPPKVRNTALERG